MILAETIARMGVAGEAEEKYQTETKEYKGAQQ